MGEDASTKVESQGGAQGQDKMDQGGENRQGGNMRGGFRGGRGGGGNRGGGRGGRFGQRGGGMGGGGGGMGAGGKHVGGNDMQIKMSDSMNENMDNSDMSVDVGGGGGGGNRNMGGGRGGRNRSMGGNRNSGFMPGTPGPKSMDDRLMERILSLNGPTLELPALDLTEKKFSGRNRLYIGNLTNDTTEEELQQMFQPYGESSEFFINREKNFAFLKLDFRANAEKAKRELDGSVRKGRVIKVRFAPSSATIKVKNLTQWVSNELLAHAFSAFGDLERAFVMVDERGKSIGEGIVEYTRKQSAQTAIRKCGENCFFLTASLRPCVVEAFEPNDDIDGYPDKNLSKKHPDFFKFRDVGPRFATTGSFEHEFGTRWKQLHELFKQKEDALRRELNMEEEKLEAQMEFARYEHETEMLREQLRMREADRDRQKREWEMKERQAEEQRTREEDLRRRQQEEMALRMRRQEEELHRRQQENNVFMQEQAMRGGGGGGGKNFDNMGNERDAFAQDGGNMPVDPKSFMDQYERNNRGGQIMDLMDMRVDRGNQGGGGGRWQRGNDRNQPGEDFPNKRRRY